MFPRKQLAAAIFISFRIEHTKTLDRSLSLFVNLIDPVVSSSSIHSPISSNQGEFSEERNPQFNVYCD